MNAVQDILDQIYSLNVADQLAVFEALATHLGKLRFSSLLLMPNDLEDMARDPEVQRENAAINVEFATTEMDGL